MFRSCFASTYYVAAANEYVYEGVCTMHASVIAHRIYLVTPLICSCLIEVNPTSSPSDLTTS